MRDLRVWAMRNLKEAGMTYKEIGKVFGISHLVALKEIAGPELHSVISRAKGKCEECGKRRKRLGVHHTNYIKNTVIVLCPSCHKKKHRYPRRMATHPDRTELVDQAILDCR